MRAVTQGAAFRINGLTAPGLQFREAHRPAVEQGLPAGGSHTPGSRPQAAQPDQPSGIFHTPHQFEPWPLRGMLWPGRLHGRQVGMLSLGRFAVTIPGRERVAHRDKIPGGLMMMRTWKLLPAVATVG